MPEFARAAVLLPFLLASAGTAGAQPARAALELFVGAPTNLGAMMEIEQEGHETLSWHAAYRSEPFERPIYWAIRLSGIRTSRGWSLELMHHKLFLEDAPVDVQSFSITHGFNFLSVQHAWPVASFHVRCGLGVVLAHPENEIRHRKIDEGGGLFGSGYHATGPVLSLALGRRPLCRGPLAFVVEGRASVAPVTVPVGGGEAHFTNVALHLLVGVGFFRD